MLQLGKVRIRLNDKSSIKCAAAQPSSAISFENLYIYALFPRRFLQPSLLSFFLYIYAHTHPYTYFPYFYISLHVYVKGSGYARTFSSHRFFIKHLLPLSLSLFFTIYRFSSLHRVLTYVQYISPFRSSLWLYDAVTERTYSFRTL